MNRTVALEGMSDLANDVLHATERGEVLWLTGELGSGKTTFTTRLVEAAGGSGATSPTFSLVHFYETADGRIAHADCYRLRDPEEGADLDLSTLARDCRLTMIEWPDRAGRYAPDPDWKIHFEHRNQNERFVRVERTS